MLIAAWRLAYRAAFQILRVWWFVARPHTYGVKLVVLRGEEVLFVRHTYGHRDVWELPGGGLRRAEPPQDAARREAAEELGLHIADWTPIGVVRSRHHATADLTCFSAAYDGQPLRLSRAELQEARWASPASPPQPLGRDAVPVIALLGSVRTTRRPV